MVTGFIDQVKRVNQLCDSLLASHAELLERKNIRANALCPVWITTPMVDRFIEGSGMPRAEMQKLGITSVAELMYVVQRAEVPPASQE